MIKKTTVSMTALVLGLGLVLAGPVRSQSPEAAPGHGGMSEHHQMIGDMMKEMSQEMNKMMEQTAGGEPTPEQRRQMSQRMESMSKMMHRMSGLEGRPAMKGPEMQKQMEQMRRQMDEMKRDPAMKSPAK